MTATSNYLNRPYRTVTQARHEQPEYRRLCRSAAGRARLLRAVEALAKELDATIERDEFEDPREIGLCMRKGDYYVAMCFDGQSHVGAFLGHWNVRHGQDVAATFPKNFGLRIGGSVNQYHFRKATTCTESFDDFLASLRAGWEALAETPQ